MIPLLRAILLCALMLPAYAKDAPLFSTTDVIWHDATRDRDVPARIYAPSTGNGPFPVIIFSHGLGGSSHGYSYLGEYWASHGYMSVHVQHHGSDTAVALSMLAAKGAMKDVNNYIERPKDISFAIDEVTALNQADGPWHGKFDLKHIGVAGHSFGAYTTMAIAGANPSLPNGEVVKLGDPRVKAIIAMSVPHLKQQDFSTVHIPALHFTGTNDKIVIAPDDSVKYRRMPYDQSPGPDTYLVILNGGTHMTFSGREGLLETEDQKQRDAVFHELVCQGTTAFWDTYLKGNFKAGDWLSKGGYAKLLGDRATFEQK